MNPLGGSGDTGVGDPDDGDADGDRDGGRRGERRTPDPGPGRRRGRLLPAAGAGGGAVVGGTILVNQDDATATLVKGSCKPGAEDSGADDGEFKFRHLAILSILASPIG